MSKKNKEEVIVDVEQVYSKSEEFIEKNKKPITAVAIALIVIVSSFYGYKKLYLEPLEEEAKNEVFRAEQYFKKDSLELAINGDEEYLGFADIADEYSATKTGNLANYYLGISYLRLGRYEEAIDALEDFSSSDVMLSCVALGATGDAYMELGETEKAIGYYENAAYHNENDFTTPLYLMKAANILENIGDYDQALDFYKEIRDEYPKSEEGRQVEKYIARAESFVK